MKSTRYVLVRNDGRIGITKYRKKKDAEEGAVLLMKLYKAYIKHADKCNAEHPRRLICRYEFTVKKLHET